MPINPLNFFNTLDKDTDSVVLSFANPKELYTRYRQMNKKTKVEAELCLLSHHDSKAHEYQLEILLHIAANLDNYVNYPNHVKSRYIKVLASLLKDVTDLSSNLRMTGLYILSAFSSSPYQLPANLHAIIVDRVHYESYFTNEQPRLVIALSLSNPQQKSVLFNQLLLQASRLNTKVLKQIIRLSDSSQCLALFHRMNNYLDTLILEQSQTSPVIERLTLILPNIDAKLQKIFFDKWFIKIKNHLPACDTIPLNFLMQLFANIDETQRSALMNAYSHTDCRFIEAICPYLNDVQLSILLDKLSAIINGIWHQTYTGLDVLIILYRKLPERAPLFFPILANLLHLDYGSFMYSANKILTELIIHVTPEQIDNLFVTLIIKCHDADMQDDIAATEFLGGIITHCNEAQKDEFIDLLISKLRHKDFYVSNKAQMIARDLVKHCSDEQQIVLLDLLLNKLNAPQNVQNAPPSHEALILIDLPVLIPYYKKHQRLGLLVASIINKLTDASLEYLNAATFCLNEMLPHCDEQVELAMILEQLVKTLDKEADYIILPLVDGLCKLIPKLDAEQRRHLYDALIYKLDLNHPTHAAAIIDILLALAPYLNSSQIDRLYLTGTLLPDTVEDNLRQAIIKAMAKLCVYCTQEQQSSLLTMLINHLHSNSVESEFVADLIKLIPYCNDAQHTLMSNAIMIKLNNSDVDIACLAITALEKLFPASRSEQQADILNYMISKLEVFDPWSAYHSGYNKIGLTAHEGLMTLLVNFNEQQYRLLLGIFKNKLLSANNNSAGILVNVFSQIALKLMHADKKELIEQMLEIIDEISEHIPLYAHVGLALVDNVCTQYLFNHAQNNGCTSKKSPTSR